PPALHSFPTLRSSDLHPVVVAPIALVVVLLYLMFTRDRWAVIRWFALSCVLAIPSLWIVLASPSYSDAQPASQVVNFFSTIGTRSEEHTSELQSRETV